MTTPLLSETAVSSEDKTLAILAHLGGIFFSVIPSLIIWLVKNDSPFVTAHAKEALNFQITLIFGFVLAFFLMLVLIGFFLFWALGVINLVLCIVAAVKASSGENFRYPLTLRLVQ